MYLISPLLTTKEQTCQSHGAKWTNTEHFCQAGNTGALCHSGLLNNTRAPAGRKLLLTGRHQEKHTSRGTHIQHYTYTHTHTEVDKIWQVSGTALRRELDPRRPQGSQTPVLTNSSFNVTYTHPLF